MKRKIYLYIADQRADLGTDTLVLMNYAFTDVQKPTAVKNSYSKQVTLPGTPANNAIFGHFSRADRRTFAGFNAMRRTPFSILDETGRMLQNGYLKLDSITRRGDIVTGYKVTLYGGLGAFLYALAFDDSGDKRTLADLDYLEGGSGELDFQITAANVAAAWARVSGDIPEVYDSIWDVINFAPAYNGCPEGDFDSDKAVGLASDMGLTYPVTDGGKTYDTNGGYVLVNLAKKHTEWDMKDLRCYLQRPILSIRAFLVAVGKWATANGYEFDYSDIPVNQYRMLWKTLPMIPSLGSFKQDTGTVAATFQDNGPTDAQQVLPSAITLSGVTTGMTLSAAVQSFMIGFKSPTPAANPGYMHTFFRPQSTLAFGFHTIIFVQLLGYSNGSIIAASPARCYADGEMKGLYVTPAKIAELAGFAPTFTDELESDIVQLETLLLASNGALGDFNYFIGGDITMRGGAFSSIRISLQTYQFYGSYRLKESGSNVSYGPFTFISAVDTGVLPWWHEDTHATRSIRALSADWVDGSGSASYRSGSSLRSGALVEKSKLLSSKYTPTDYLLSLATQFGWVLQYDEVSKRLTLLRRDSFFDTGMETIDLTDRVDRGHDIIVTPNYAGARVYEFAPEVAPGHFAEEYAQTYGFDYGIQRIDTGYQFDSAPVDLLDKSVFRAAATILESGPYWNFIFVGGAFRPSVFLDNGNTYTMWAPDGTSKNFDVPTIPSDAVVNDLNDYGHPGYDNEFAWKLDLHDADGNAVDGEDILVYYSGTDEYLRWSLSDDTAIMLALNNNKPCWNIAHSAAALNVPDFHRYDTNSEWNVEVSLDFGTPKEVDIPYIVFDEGSSAYERGWAAFLRDRYNQDTKVMLCRVNFNGIQVGPDLLRRFFYYEGAIWVLNKISNYSITTWDPVECEFIQVRDMDNYTNGQNWE